MRSHYFVTKKWGGGHMPPGPLVCLTLVAGHSVVRVLVHPKYKYFKRLEVPSLSCRLTFMQSCSVVWTFASFWKLL